MASNPFSSEPAQDLPDFVQDTEPEITPEPEAPAQETPATEPPVLDDRRPLVDQPGAVVETPETPQPAAPEKVWAGKYQTPDQLEKGYRELRELQRRTAERAKAVDQRNQEMEYRSRQLEDALNRAIPFVRRATQQPVQGPPQDPYSLEQPVVQPQPLTPDLVAPMVDQMVANRIGQYQTQQQQQQQQAQQYQAAETAIKGFFEKHPEVEVRGEADEDVASTILALNEAWSPSGSTVDISSVEALDIAYEASQRPALRQVLEMNPPYFDTDEGMTLARALATQLEGGTTQAAAPSPQGQRITTVPRPNTPVVERGSSQAPQQTPLDEFEQAVAEFRKIGNDRGSKVFFG